MGNTHLAPSLAVATVQSGRRGDDGTFTDLVTSLEEPQWAGRLVQRLGILVFPALLVIDEIGYLPVSRTAAMLSCQPMR